MSPRNKAQLRLDQHLLDEWIRPDEICIRKSKNPYEKGRSKEIYVEKLLKTCGWHIIEEIRVGKKKGKNW